MFFSIGVLDDKTARLIEPGASLPSERIRALAKIHKQAVKSSVFVSPILPGLTDCDRLFDQLKGKVDEVFGETFNPRGANFNNLAFVLKGRFPKLLKEYKKIFFTNYRQEYIQKAKKEFYQSARKHSLPVWNFFTH